MLNALESQRAQPARPAAAHDRRRPLLAADGRQQRRDLHGRARHRAARPGLVEGPLGHRRGRHQDLRRRRPRGQARLRRAARWARRCGSSSRCTPAACCPGTRCAPSARAAPRRRSSPRTEIDVPLGFATMGEVESRLGTGTLVLLDDQTCPVGMTLNMMQFFAQESCGWCTPCREGLQWTAALLEDIEYGRGEPGRPRRARRGRLVHGLRQVLLRPRAGRDAAARERAAPVPRRLRAPHRRRAAATTGATARTRRRCGGRRGERRRDSRPSSSPSSSTAPSTRPKRAATCSTSPSRSGFDLPFFCWHPVLGSIGACRQCAVRLYWTDREGNEKSEIAMACMTEAQEGTQHGHLRRGGDPLPRRDDRAHDAQPPARLPGLRRGRRVPPAGHDGDDRAQLPALPRPQADLREPGPRAVRHPRAEPLHHLLPLHALLQRLRRRPRLRRVRPAQPGVLRPRRERHARERVQRQPHRGLPHRRVRRQAVLAPLLAQVGPADGAVGVPGLRPRLHDDARRRATASCAACRGASTATSTRCSSATAAASASSSSTRRSGCARRGSRPGCCRRRRRPRTAADAGGGGRAPSRRRRSRSPSRRRRRAPASRRRRGPARRRR